MSIGYHWVGDKLRDGSPVPPNGEWLRYDGPIELCKSGLHWSESPWDALTYAPGPVLCRVETRGETITGDDKCVSRERRIISRRDMTAELRAFARSEALGVIHLWNVPEIVRQYLITGDESLRDAAWAATREAPMDAAWNAAWAAAWAAARDAAWDAAWAAAWDADRDWQEDRLVARLTEAGEP